MSAAPSRSVETPPLLIFFFFLFEWRFYWFPRAPRWRGAHSASRPKRAKPWRHDLNKHDLCRRSQKCRMRRTPSKRACAASSCNGVTASFLTHRSKVCTDAREKNGNKPFWLVAYSHFRQGREPRSISRTYCFILFISFYLFIDYCLYHISTSTKRARMGCEHGCASHRPAG